MQIKNDKEDWEELKARAEDIIKSAKRDLVIWTEIKKVAEHNL